MTKFRLIVSGPASGPENMAVDESIFNCKASGDSDFSTLRLYTWDRRCVTIGYFQKYTESAVYGLDVTRRMTGGLAVVHGQDLSFGLVMDDNSWPHVYDQEKTYQLVHLPIKDALQKCGINADFVDKAKVSGARCEKGNICVQTFYPYDLVHGGDKIVGSCQRRRGKNLLVQGSIHLPVKADKEHFTSMLLKSFQMALKASAFLGGLNSNESSSAELLKNTKYSAKPWNEKY